MTKETKKDRAKRQGRCKTLPDRDVSGAPQLTCKEKVSLTLSYFWEFDISPSAERSRDDPWGRLVCACESISLVCIKHK